MLRENALRCVRCEVIAFGLAVIAGCSGGPNPAGPSALTDAGTTAAGVTAAPPLFSQAGGSLTPADLLERGWTCFAPPVVPPLTACSHPHQGRPVAGNPPPADRPATYNLFRFDASGKFIGPVHLIRTDLYSGQICESTGAPYALIPQIGYYECAHPGGR